MHLILQHRPIWDPKRQAVYLRKLWLFTFLWRTHGVVVGSTTTDNSDPAFSPIPLWGLNPGAVKAMGVAFTSPPVVEFSLLVRAGARAKVSKHPTYCAYILTP